MTQYLVAIHHPDGYDGSTEDEAMTHDIDVLNDEMVAAGVRLFVGGLHSVDRAKTLRRIAGRIPNPRRITTTPRHTNARRR